MTDIVWNIIEILVNIYQGFICAYFMLKFLSPKPSTNVLLYYLLCGGIQSIMISVINHLTTFESYASALYIIELFIFAVLMLKGNIIKKLIASIISMLTGFLITTVCLNFFSSVNNMNVEELVVSKGYIRGITLISIQILYFASFKLILKAFATENDEFEFAEWKTVIPITAASIVMAALLHLTAMRSSDERQRIYIDLALLILIILNVIIYYLIASLMKKSMLKRELDMLRIVEHYNEQSIKNMSIQNSTIKKMRHDMKNTLSALGKLLQDGNIASAQSLLSQNQQILKSTGSYISTNNSIVNAVINSKLENAASVGIRPSCISVNDITGIKDVDLCDLLSNMLDNAITACLEADEKQITVDIFSDNDMYTFTVKNSIGRSVLNENPKLKTTKHDHTNHGYGTKIIKGIAEKYNGRCDFYEQGDMFCCKIILMAKHEEPNR